MRCLLSLGALRSSTSAAATLSLVILLSDAIFRSRIKSSVTAFTPISLSRCHHSYQEEPIRSTTSHRQGSQLHSSSVLGERSSSSSQHNTDDADDSVVEHLRERPVFSHFHDFNPDKVYHDPDDDASTTTGVDDSRNNHRWLEWIGFRCQEAPLGTLAPHVVKDVPPVMNIYAKRRSRQGAVLAESLLTRLLDETRAGNEAVELTNTVFNVAMDGWAKSGVNSAGENAERIFSLMDRIHKEGHSPKVKQDTISFTTVIAAWANSNAKGSARRACALLGRLERMGAANSDNGEDTPRPNTVSYNVCLAALARSNDRNAAVVAEELVERMEQLSDQDSRVKPDVITYQSLIHAWSHSRRWGSPQRAEEILKYMDDLSETDHNVKPNVFCFTAAINAWSKSVEQDKVERARNILTYMQRLYKEGRIDEPPNVFTFTSVINTACYPCFNRDGSNREQKKIEAFKVAAQTMNEIQESDYASANHVTYGAFLNACFRLLPANNKEEIDNEHVIDKWQAIKTTFQQAARDGQMGHVVVEKLISSSPQGFIRDLIPTIPDSENEITIADLDTIVTCHIPKEWRCNVRGEKKPRGKKMSDGARSKRSADVGSNNHRAYLSQLRGKSGYYSKKREGINSGEVTTSLG